MSKDSFTTLTEDINYQTNFSFRDYNRQTLFGRNLELDLLCGAYDLIKREKSFQKVIVHGESGTGKTSLIFALREYVVHHGGFFCTGKQFQDSGLGQDLYPALIAAFSDLCDMVMQSKDFNEQRRAEIQEALRNDGELLVKAGANISPLLNIVPQFTASKMVSDETVFTKFKIVCRNYLRTMASAGHPVILFLDDVQWMDKGTEEIIKFLLQDKDIGNFMLILAHRDEGSESIKRTLISQIEPNLVIPLRNLDCKCIKDMLSSELGDKSQDINNLSALISRKTGGNPFYAKQFISSIQKEGFLKKVNGRYHYDIDIISAEMMISDCLAELLSNKVQKLDIRLQEILKVASLLGYSFSDVMLDDIMNQISNQEEVIQENAAKCTRKTLQSFLNLAVEERFLEKNSGGYQFSHDKLQATFHLMMKKDEREKLHLLIGRRLLNYESDKILYQAAVHLNLVSESFFHASQERIELAKLNLRIARYCELKSACLESVYFLRKGLALLDSKEKWTTNFDIAFEISEALARMEFIVGNLDACKRVNKEVLQRAKSDEMKTRALLLEVEVRVAYGDLSEMVPAGRKAVNQILNIKIPVVVTIANCLLRIKKVRKLLNKMTDEEILNLPVVEDPKFSIAIKVLMRICVNCVCRQKYDYGSYAAMIATELSLTVGLSPHSAYAFYCFGAVEVASDFGEKNFGKRGFRLGELSLKLLKKFPFKDAECNVLSGLVTNILFFRRPIRGSLDLYPDALNDGFEIGDIVSVSICACYTFNIKLWSGENLDYLETLMRDTYYRMKDLGHQNILLLNIQIYLQLVLNMQRCGESWEDLVVLSGEIMDEERCMKMVRKKSTGSFHLVFLFLSKMFLAYSFGFYELADTARKMLKSTGDTYIIEKTYLTLPFQFYSAMTLYELYRSDGKRHRLRAAQKILKYFAKEHSQGNPNASPYFRILEVEELSLKSKDSTKIQYTCDEAIDQAARAGLTHLEALANEQANRVFLQLKGVPNRTSNRYLDKALHLYRNEWGAIAKYEWLLEKYNGKRIERKEPIIEDPNLIDCEIDIRLHDDSTVSLPSTKDCHELNPFLKVY